MNHLKNNKLQRRAKRLYALCICLALTAAMFVIPFHPDQWRQGKSLPKVQGLVLGSQGKKGKITALVDSDDIHCLMIGAAGVGNQNLSHELFSTPDDRN